MAVNWSNVGQPFLDSVNSLSQTNIISGHTDHSVSLLTHQVYASEFSKQELIAYLFMK